MRAAHPRRGERERERDKRSVDRLIQSNLGGREGTAMLGTKRGRSRRLPTPPAPREVVSLHSDYNPTPQNPKKFSRWCSGASEIASETQTHTRHKRSRRKRDGPRSRVDLGSRAVKSNPGGIGLTLLIIIRRRATLASGPTARAPSGYVRET